MNRDQIVLEYIVKELVDFPGDVMIERVLDERGVLLTLHVNPADMGKVIGISGKMADSLRVILRGVGAKHAARVNLKIAEPPKPEVVEAPKTALEDIDSALENL